MKPLTYGRLLRALVLPVVASALFAPSLLAQPSLSISGTNVNEGDAGTVQAVVTVTLTPASSETVSVSYESSQATPPATGGGSCATSGVDFERPTGSLQFAPGVTSQPISVTVCGDVAQEADEKFRVRLFGAQGATIATSQGPVTIVDDDDQPPPPPPPPPPPLPSLSLDDASFPEGASGREIRGPTARLSSVSTQPVTATVVVVAGGTATGAPLCLPGKDFSILIPATVTIAPGQNSVTVPFGICGDTASEPDETFSVSLANPSGATLGDVVGVVTIRNDDEAPVAPPPPTGVPLIISSFQIKGGALFATFQTQPLNVTATGNPTEFRSTRSTSTACEAALEGEAFKPFSASPPPIQVLDAGLGRRFVCIQLRRGTATSTVAKDDIEIVPSQSSSIVMGRNLEQRVGVDAQQVVSCSGIGNSFAVGIRVRASALVDAIGLRCAEMGANGEHLSVTSTPLIGGGGGSLRVLDCAPGQVLYGLQGRSGEFIDQVGIRCIGWRADIGSNGTHILRASAGGTGGDSAFGPVVCPGPLAVRTLTSRKHLGLVGGLRFSCSAPRGM